MEPAARNPQRLLPLARAAPPQPPVRLARRERLEALAARLLSVPLALVTGPGGYGKTTLLLAWHQVLALQTRCVWLTLTPDEASLTALAEAVAVAFERALPAVGAAARSVMERREGDARAYACALANELYVATEESGEDVALFVDDAHTVTADAESSRYLSLLLQGLPRRVHVVVASRHAVELAPVAKLRNAGRLLEVHASDLRFRADEAAVLLQDREIAQSVVERTGGWAIAVQSMAALAQDGQYAAPERLPPVNDAIFAFLAQEVMMALDPDLRELLRPLAIPAALDAQVVEHVLERTDGAAIIARLVQRNLYIERAEGETWRLHQLFREFLLENFRVEDPQRERETRRRYARYLRERGEKLAALEQLLEAHDLSEIVEYTREALLTVRFTDRYRRLLDLLAQLPQDVKQRKPTLYRLQALAMQRAGRWEQADSQLGACFEAAMSNADAGTACLALIDRGIGRGNFRFRMHGGHEVSHADFQRALELAEGPALHDLPAYRKVAYEVLGLAHALAFEYDRALELLGRAEQLELAEQSHVELVFVEIARVYGWMGDWRRALEYAELAEELFRVHAQFHLGYALIVQAKALVMLGEDRERAMAACEEAISSLRDSFEDEELGAAYAVYAEALLAASEPDFDAVRAACAQAERFLDPHNAAVRCDVALVRAAVAAYCDDDEQQRSAMRLAHRLAGEDAWLAARASLQDARIAYARKDFTASLEGGESARAAFAACGDRFHAALAGIVSCASRARTDALGSTAASQALREIDACGAHVVLHAPRASADLLRSCLERGIESHIVYRLAELLPAMRGVLRPESETQPELEISVITGLSARVGETLLAEGDAKWGRRKAAELLRLLAVSGAPVSKAAAIAALWPDAEKGREVTLRVAVHALRRALQPDVPGSNDYIVFDGTTVSLRRARVKSIDAERALALIDRGKHLASLGQSPQAEPALAQAAELLVVAQKEGDAPAWLVPHLRRWRSAAIEGLRALAQLQHSQRRFEDAAATVRRALSLDPFDEAAVLLALEIFGELGALTEARSLYAAYKRRLADVLQAVPGSEVTQRYSRLLQQRRESKRTDLSKRELEILRLVAAGQTSKDIGAALRLSAFTVNNHVGRILKKLGVESRAAAVAQLRAIEGSA